ncbi:MoxR family ATPase [Candidatus Methylospira mobilis]|uniref:MoxR family ATPase n=1 Tax=Candidatus Methylospira mobilis TaxID=1808979 RepID=A0A5Q0BE14_9GAMM|nr:MoxR family ATPase [Candidatus Methylospira mobilis]QFY42095.1 MoxR family ATPase [Candidatus Methylospira mobilis]WNV03104.1 MoxR family ATPase [Candidatus Methylospira mobilis]
MPTSGTDELLQDWRQRALRFEQAVNAVILGQQLAVRHIAVALFAGGHVMLEGDVGVGKTTLLRAVTRGLGGVFERVEGVIDLMPSDLLYHTHINEQGRPEVNPGPLLKHGEELSVFFFNEINRARPHVHALMLRVMAERSVSAFNRVHELPYVLVFADRNRVERNETFELPSAVRDRFLVEIQVGVPESEADQLALMFDTRFHDVERLLNAVPENLLPYQSVQHVGRTIQGAVQASDAIQHYALRLWQATRNPLAYGIRLQGVEMDRLILAGASARAMGMLMQAARVSAWREGRSYLLPEDIRSLFHEVIAHRIFLQPVYEMRREQIVKELVRGILDQVAAP